MRVNENTPMAVVLEVMEVTNALRGKRFSITGHLGRPRDEIVKIIEQAGGFFDKAPTYGTNFLVTNKDWSKGAINGAKSNKLRKAESLGVKIISESRFYEMIVENGQTLADAGFGAD